MKKNVFARRAGYRSLHCDFLLQIALQKPLLVVTIVVRVYIFTLYFGNLLLDGNLTCSSLGRHTYVYELIITAVGYTGGLYTNVIIYLMTSQELIY